MEFWLLVVIGILLIIIFSLVIKLIMNAIGRIIRKIWEMCRCRNIQKAI